MGTIWVREFTGGLDTRRLPETTPGGLLIRARDGHITRGGEFEKRAAFIAKYELPADATKGLGHTNAGLVVFGHAAAPVLPAGLTYHQIVHPSAPTTPIRRLLSYDLYKGKLYVVAEFENGNVRHYYNGVHVASWLTLGYTPGPFARTVSRKMYSVSGPLLHFSALDNPADLDPLSTGAGFIDVSADTSGAEVLKSVARYQGFLAVFSERTTIIQSVDPDPALNRQVQVLNNTGTIAPRSVTQFGDNDVFYLAHSGLRSLRARDASNAAATTDIGVAIDDLVVSDIRGLSDTERESIVGLIEPNSGRFWLSVQGRIYVFSFFSGAKVSAWSTYEPGFVVENMIPFGDTVYLRSGDTIFVYGGESEAEYTYDSTEAEAWLPYLDADKPTEKKMWQGIDAACQGLWEVRVGMDPNDQTASDKIATIDKTTYNLGKISGLGESTHCSLRFRSQGTGPAKLAAAVLHYAGDEGDDD